MSHASEDEANLHGRFSVTGTSDTFFIHGGKRAPTRIRALPEGPNIGLTTGCIWMGVKNLPVGCRNLTYMERNRATLGLGIHHQFINKYDDHDDS